MPPPAAQRQPPPARPPDGAPPACSLAEQVLSRAQSGRQVIQDFCPLAESLEWQLGQEYLRDRGNKVFISDASPIPFVVNNDGTLSRHAAEVFFASLKDAEEQGTLGPDEEIVVLELGVGIGLFARYFLDAFRQLCDLAGRDYYDRLCYVAADRSPRMLSDLLRHGVLAGHPGRYRVRQVDAMRPQEWLSRDLMFRGRAGPPLRAVLLNYLLDCLPAAVLDLGEAVRQLHVRTCVARNVRLKDHTDLTVTQLAQRAALPDARARRDLLEVYGLFASEYDYRPVDVSELPLGEFALSFGRGKSRRLLHSFGAIESLEALLGHVADDGFVLLNDYGTTQAGDGDDFEHQRFSLATFVGVNFAQLQEYFAQHKGCTWVEPHGGGRSLHSRLLGRRLSHGTRLRFAECFGQARREHLDGPREEARRWQKAGRYELAAGCYREAVRRQPYNWVLLEETAAFLIFSMRDVKAGVEMAKLALAQNPTCSAELWNTLGDGLFEFGRLEEARSAYHKALAVNETDVRARYNLAWLYLRQRDPGAALAMIAQALTLDRSGAFRERLLAKQQEAVALQATLHQQEFFLLANLVSRHVPPGAVEPGRPEPAWQAGTLPPQ